MILKDNIEVSALQDKLANHSKIVITTHLNPDGDAIGSMLGLSGYLHKKGHEVFPITPNEYPEFLKWIPGNEKVLDFSKKTDLSRKILKTADFIFILDYNDAKRGGEMEKSIHASKAIKVMVDHHPYPQIQVNYSLSFTEVSSTCELIYELIMALGGRQLVDKPISTCLYTGIMTDTGCFSYNASRIRTFEIVSELLGHGIEKDEIYHLIYDNFSFQRMRLLGYCLHQKMEHYPEFNTAFISLTLEDQKTFDFTIGDSEGFVNLPLSIKGVIFSALFIERKDKVKISFRSRGQFPVHSFSEKHFSGGGHFNASGGESTLSMEDTLKKFVDLLSTYAKALNAK